MTHPNFQLLAHPLGVTAWSTDVLPLDPKEWGLELRDELRTRIREMRFARSGLRATWWCAREGIDLENALLYNVGVGTFAKVAGPLALLHRRSGAPAAPGRLDAPVVSVVEYAVDATAPSPPTPLVELRGELVGGALRPAAVWRAVHEGEGTVSALPEGDLSLWVAVSGTVAHSTVVIKPLVDGLLCALHRYSGNHEAIVLSRLWGIDPDRGRDWLYNEERGVLGDRRFVFPRLSELQWSPADDRLGELVVDVRRDGPARFHAVLGAARPDPDPA